MAYVQSNARLQINSEYIEMICSDSSKEVNSDNDRLEAMVRESLVKEFSPNVENMKSYELLVDAVVHNLKKNSFKPPTVKKI